MANMNFSVPSNYFKILVLLLQYLRQVSLFLHLLQRNKFLQHNQTLIKPSCNRRYKMVNL